MFPSFITFFYLWICSCKIIVSFPLILNYYDPFRGRYRQESMLFFFVQLSKWGRIGSFMLCKAVYHLRTKRHGRRVILLNPATRVKLIKYVSSKHRFANELWGFLPLIEIEKKTRFFLRNFKMVRNVWKLNNDCK